MNFKNFLSIFVIVALTVIGWEASNATRKQEIKISGVAIEGSENNDLLVAQFEDLLLNSGIKEVSFSKDVFKNEITFSFESDLSTKEIRDLFEVLKTDYYSASIVNPELLDFKISYVNDSGPETRSGCDGVLLKEFYKDSVRSNSVHLLSSCFLSDDQHLNSLLSVSKVSFEALDSHLYFSNYSFIADARAGPELCA